MEPNSLAVEAELLWTVLADWGDLGELGEETGQGRRNRVKTE